MERAIILTSPRPVGVQPERWKQEYRQLRLALEGIVAGRDLTAMTAVEVTVLTSVKTYLNRLTVETNRTHERWQKHILRVTFYHWDLGILHHCYINLASAVCVQRWCNFEKQTTRLHNYCVNLAYALHMHHGLHNYWLFLNCRSISITCKLAVQPYVQGIITCKAVWGVRKQQIYLLQACWE
jgi:hypothetical protein